MTDQNQAAREAVSEPMERMLNWFVNGDVGLSSTTLAAWIAGIPCNRPSRPLDAQDARRCALLLIQFPEVYWEDIAYEYPEWERCIPMIQEQIERLDPGYRRITAAEPHG